LCAAPASGRGGNRRRLRPTAAPEAPAPFTGQSARQQTARQAARCDARGRGRRGMREAGGGKGDQGAEGAPCCQQRECKVGTLVGATVGSGGGRACGERWRFHTRMKRSVPRKTRTRCGPPRPQLLQQQLLLQGSARARAQHPRRGRCLLSAPGERQRVVLQGPGAYEIGPPQYPHRLRAGGERESHLRIMMGGCG
jgi:hypothetical protein